MKKWEYETIVLDGRGILGGKIDVEGFKTKLSPHSRLKPGGS